jgi:ABC-type oligopeptide transport system substrate-binding subunit
MSTGAAACPKLPGLCHWFSKADTPCPYSGVDAATTLQANGLKKTQNGYEVEIPLRKKMSWQDGHKIDPEDFVLGWHAIRKQQWYKGQTPYRYLRRVQHNKKGGLTLTYSRQVYDFLDLAKLKPVPASISPSSSCITREKLMQPQPQSMPIRRWVLLVNQRHPHWKHVTHRQQLSKILQAAGILASFQSLFGEYSTLDPESTAGQETAEEELTVPEEGRKVELLFKNSQGSLAIAGRVANVLEASGLRIRKRVVKSSEALQKTLQEMDHRGLALVEVEYPLGNTLRNMIHSGRIPSQINHYKGANYSAFQNSSTDEIIEVLERTTSAKKRAKQEERLLSNISKSLPFWVLRM